MDNFSIDITSEGAKALEMALTLAWGGAPGGKATHYFVKKYKNSTTYYPGEKTDKGFVHPTHHSERLVESPDGIITLVFLWHEERDGLPLPFPLTLSGAIDFVRGWLESGVEWGGEPDHDGDNGKGWRVFNEAWGHVEDHHYSICAIQPAWAMYGK